MKRFLALFFVFAAFNLYAANPPMYTPIGGANRTISYGASDGDVWTWIAANNQWEPVISGGVTDTNLLNIAAKWIVGEFGDLRIDNENVDIGSGWFIGNYSWTNLADMNTNVYNLGEKIIIGEFGDMRLDGEDIDLGGGQLIGDVSWTNLIDIPLEFSPDTVSASTYNIGSGVVTNNLAALLSSGITNVVDLDKAATYNLVGGNISYAHATNGAASTLKTHVAMLPNWSGTTYSLTIPSGWKTNAFIATPGLTNGTITKMYVTAHDATSDANNQTNVTVSFEFYK